MFNISLTNFHVVHIDPQSHKAYAWVTPKEAFEKDLIPDLDTCIKLYYKD
jgi:hypothetical protein